MDRSDCVAAVEAGLVRCCCLGRCSTEVQTRIPLGLACRHVLLVANLFVSDLKSRTRMNGVSSDYPGGACRKPHVGCSGATRPIIHNSQPLIKLDCPTVINVGVGGTNHKFLLKLRIR
jgi:hypothetical protein